MARWPGSHKHLSVWWTLQAASRRYAWLPLCVTLCLCGAFVLSYTNVQRDETAVALAASRNLVSAAGVANAVALPSAQSGLSAPAPGFAPAGGSLPVQPPVGDGGESNSGVMEEGASAGPEPSPRVVIKMGPPAANAALERSLRAATQNWNSFPAQSIQVDYMRTRMLSRSETWLQALRSMQPQWVPVHRLGREGGQTVAIVWPLASYMHFGVTRVWSLGEYTQWADLCAALLTLGVKVKLWPWTKAGNSYPRKADYDSVDLVFTDYDGIHGGWRFADLPPPDKTWILDTFGTDGTVVKHDFFGRKLPLSRYPLSRFLTLVPAYSARNTFLGAAAVAPLAAAVGAASQAPKKEWRCVLWSKVHPWLNQKSGHALWHRELLKEYTRHCHVVATVDMKDTYKTKELIEECCPSVEIRGVQDPSSFRELLRQSAVYVGVGEPLIAPSCLEALSVGTHVVQPRFPKPRILPNKGSTQGWTSQHPFLEQVGEPYAYTVNVTELRASVSRAFAAIRKVFDEAAVAGGNHDLADFYRIGRYPLRDVYSLTGFLERTGHIVRRTRPLQPEEWEFERGLNIAELPPEAFPRVE